MAEKIIEPIAEEPLSHTEKAENETTTDMPQDLPAEAAPVASPPIPKPTAQPKRKPGRPKGSTNKAKASPAPKPKAAPPKPKANPYPDNDDSSSSEEDQRIFTGIMQDDMETQVLQFLTARKKDQVNKRHALWTNLASCGLR